MLYQKREVLVQVGGDREHSLQADFTHNGRYHQAANVVQVVVVSFHTFAYVPFAGGYAPARRHKHLDVKPFDRAERINIPPAPLFKRWYSFISSSIGKHIPAKKHPLPDIVDRYPAVPFTAKRHNFPPAQ